MTNAAMPSRSYMPVFLAGLAVAGVIIFASQPPHEVMEIIFGAVADAYIQVSTFVAATLFLFYGLEKWLRVDLTALLKQSGRWQVPVAALLGALPGCGGAIIVVTRYVSGHLSFGAVLATLTATMGDAAFLLLAKEPATGLLVMGAGLIIGTISGYLVDGIHGQDFLRGKGKPVRSVATTQRALASPAIERIWVILFIPGIIVGLFTAFQIDLDAVLATSYIQNPATSLGFIGGTLCLLMWGVPQFINSRPDNQDTNIVRRTITDTNFVTSWVIFAFLIFEIGIYLFDFNLKDALSGFGVMLPLMAVIIGLLPGCGPQVIVTSLYLAGAIPLSAQLGNAISNDGDALFPAIALAPKTAIIATLYSTIPAVIFAYGWFMLFEL